METKTNPTTDTTKKQDDKEIERMVVAQAKTASAKATEQQVAQDGELDDRTSKAASANR